MKQEGIARDEIFQELAELQCRITKLEKMRRERNGDNGAPINQAVNTSSLFFLGK